MLLVPRHVTSPDGHRWVVSVDWTRRKVQLPSAWRKKDGKRMAMPDACDCVNFGEGLVSSLVFLVVGLLVLLALWLVVWPLLALAIEASVALSVLVAGLIGRLVFGKPWIVEAVGGEDRHLRWTVQGVGAAHRVIGEVSDALAAGVEPVPLQAEPYWQT